MTGRRSISFISYNPFEDQRIDPLNGKDLFVYIDLPDYIHDAVARAKELVGNTSLDNLKVMSAELDRMVNCHSYAFSTIKNSKKNYGEANESDNLKAFLTHAKHEHKPENWPVLFGCLALSLAGEIVNILWPTSEYLEEISCEVALIQSINASYNPSKLTDGSKGLVKGLAVEAVRSVGFGEGLLLENQYKKEKQDAAKKPPKLNQRLYDAFNSWAVNQPQNHGFRTTEDAVDLGFKQYLREKVEVSELLKVIGDTTHRRLKKSLEEHCLENNKQYPFPRLRSKK